MTSNDKVISPSRTYVAICNKSNFDGHYFKKFVLPDTTCYFGEDRNNASSASWYFLNALDAVSCIEGCFAAEDFADIVTI
jgi:hypothetical protein